jgi:hypothetical protein
MEMSKIKRVESRDEAICRLAAEAKRKGIQIFVYPMTNEHFATSSSNPEQLHRVTLLSCDCAGFFSHGRCTHHSALLEFIGELPEIEPEPTPFPAERISYPTPAPDKFDEVLNARADLDRLESLNERGHIKSTADFRSLHNARARFAELTMPADLVAIGA